MVLKIGYKNWLKYINFDFNVYILSYTVPLIYTFTCNNLILA